MSRSVGLGTRASMSQDCSYNYEFSTEPMISVPIRTIDAYSDSHYLNEQDAQAHDSGF